MTVATSQTERLGANPFVIDGPFVAGSGYPAPNFALGTIAWGPSEAEWVYVKLVLASTTTMQPGMWLQWDKDYNASLLTTANAVIGQRCGVFAGSNTSPAVTGGNSTVTLAAGTYYLWLQRAGQAPALMNTVTANLVIAETTTTAGQANAPASATVGTKQITPVSFAAANQTFTATTTNGSSVLTALSGASLGSGPFLGASISGTGIPALTTIASISYSPSGQVQSITMSANATANGTGVTVTATGVLEVALLWPYIAKTN